MKIVKHQYTQLAVLLLLGVSVIQTSSCQDQNALHQVRHIVSSPGTSYPLFYGIHSGDTTGSVVPHPLYHITPAQPLEQSTRMTPHNLQTISRILAEEERREKERRKNQPRSCIGRCLKWMRGK